MSKLSSKSSAFTGVLSALILALLAGPAWTADYALEIIQPRPNLDSGNRFYRAYPGLEYNVRLAVVGGVYPYDFSLAKAPEGMTIDARGTINWPLPTAQETPYSVTATVTDRAGQVRDVSWNINVTTAGFVFVDATRGKARENGGEGTISNPFLTMKDIYGGDDHNSKYSSHLPGNFVYWRAGIYNLDAYIEDCHLSDCRVPWSNRKPVVWLSYPGETPVINMNRDGRNARIFFYGGNDHLYLDGMEFNANSNSRGMAVAAGTASNMTFRRNTFHGVTVSQSGGNNSLLFLTGGSGIDNVIQDNVFDGRQGGVGYALLGYGSYKTLVEDNIVRALDIGLSPKTDNRNWFIRGNLIKEMKAGARCLLIQAYPTTNNIDISYNRILCPDIQAVRINNQASDTIGPVTVARNSIIGSVEAIHTTSTNGPFTFERNVIVNDSQQADHITRFGIQDPDRLIVRDNLVGTPQDGILNSSGELTEQYQEFIGTHGAQVGPSIPVPKSPEQVNIE